MEIILCKRSSLPNFGPRLFCTIFLTVLIASCGGEQKFDPSSASSFKKNLIGFDANLAHDDQVRLRNAIFTIAMQDVTIAGLRNRSPLEAFLVYFVSGKPDDELIQSMLQGIAGRTAIEVIQLGESASMTRTNLLPASIEDQIAEVKTILDGAPEMVAARNAVGSQQASLDSQWAKIAFVEDAHLEVSDSPFSKMTLSLYIINKSSMPIPHIGFHLVTRSSTGGSQCTASYDFTDSKTRPGLAPGARERLHLILIGSGVSCFLSNESRVVKFELVHVFGQPLDPDGHGLDEAEKELRRERARALDAFSHANTLRCILQNIVSCPDVSF